MVVTLSLLALLSSRVKPSGFDHKKVVDISCLCSEYANHLHKEKERNIAAHLKISSGGFNGSDSSCHHIRIGIHKRREGGQEAMTPQM